jgi:alkylation response protein AidB-like acyl-CoA dehydrogenase
MSSYRAPISEIMTTLDVVGLDTVLEFPQFEQVDRTTIRAALTEFGRFVEKEIVPTDQPGDVLGSFLDSESGLVVVPEGFHRAYRGLAEGGWTALAFPTGCGGGGWPSLVGMAIQEMLASANLSFSLNPALTQSAIELLLTSGSESQRRRFLPPMMKGTWTGTMNLTEPSAGSDLGQIQTLAEPDGDHWRLTGTKVFITWGEHDLTENILHFVLARTPGSPPGTSGLSIFVAPKYLVDESGQIQSKNSITCLRVERKLGLHASPTCVLAYDGASAELVGPLHGGMRAMFTMMNVARLAIAIQGPSIGEAAYQQAVEYAHTRSQGKLVGATSPDRSFIVDHPDVRRMLLNMRVLTLASRLMVYLVAGYRDRARHERETEDQEAAAEYVALLTPVAKAWATQAGVDIASLGIQVLGGIGYLEETGMAQRWRDSRITPIYEGTNGIQAIDLVIRKIPRQGGVWFQRLMDEISTEMKPWRSYPEFDETFEIQDEALSNLRMATDWILERATSAPNDALAGASAYLELFGAVLGGWLMVRRAVLARGTAAADRSASEARYYGTEILAPTCGLTTRIMGGADRLGGAVLSPVG